MPTHVNQNINGQVTHWFSIIILQIILVFHWVIIAIDV